MASPSEPGLLKRVLVADDDQAVCALLERVLRPLARVTSVGDGEAALAAVRAGRFDAIVSDFGLPGMDGLDFVRLVRAEHPLPPIPILLISGHGSEVGDARARAAGADAFLAKPFSLEQLRAALAALLREA